MHLCAFSVNGESPDKQNKHVALAYLDETRKFKFFLMNGNS